MHTYKRRPRGGGLLQLTPAIMGACTGAKPIHKATIMPRGHALGMVTQVPAKDEFSVTKQQIHADIDVCMGGKAAEELIFGSDQVRPLLAYAHPCAAPTSCRHSTLSTSFGCAHTALRSVLGDCCKQTVRTGLSVTYPVRRAMSHAQHHAPCWELCTGVLAACRPFHTNSQPSCLYPKSRPKESMEAQGDKFQAEAGAIVAILSSYFANVAGDDRRDE